MALKAQRRIAAILLCGVALAARLACGDAYDPPASYYNAATGTGATLKGQLLTIMSTGQIQRTYGDFRYSTALQDQDPNNPNNILLMYADNTNIRSSVPGTWDSTPAALWNREHVWPVSLQGGNDPSNTTTGHRADPFSLRPADPGINTSRGNKPYGFEDTTGGHGAVAGGYYFPGDADKGDAARSLFYSETRYGPSLGLTLTDAVPGGFQMGDLSSLLAWHYLDVPDTFERRRNQVIYSQALNPTYYTNNRNAYIDHPEFVWSVFVNQTNDSQISIAGATVNANGSSTRNVDLGRVFTGGSVPGAQNFTLNKAGNNGTYYEVTTGGAATSSISGRFNAFRTNAPDSKSISVGLNTNTTTAGLRSGTVTVDNLDITPGSNGGVGHGANDNNDTFNVSLTVLDHSQPSYQSGSTLTTLTHDFGTLNVGSSSPSFGLDVFNQLATAGFTANMDFDSVVASGIPAGFDTTSLTAAAGSLVLVGGASQNFATLMNTGALGAFSATYTLMFSDENITGALNKSLTLMLTGQVKLLGDYNEDNVVDAADYVVWQDSIGQGVTAYSGADGNGDSMVDADDYLVWTANFGRVASGTGAAVFAAVPEPGAWVLMIIGVAFGTLSRQRRG